MKRFLIIILLFCATLPWLRAEYRHTFRFEPSDFYTETRFVEGKEYTLPRMRGLENEEVEGMPSLPVLQATIAVPYNAENFRIEVNESQTQNIEFEGDIAPSFYDITVDAFNEGERIIPYFKKDITGIYPENISSVVSPARWCGRFQTVTISVYPLVYYNTNKRLTINTALNVELIWDEGKVEPSQTGALSMTEQNRLEILKETVLNPEAYKTIKPQKIITPDDVLIPEVKEAEYVIITTEALREPFEILAAMRKTRGYSSAIFTMEYIKSLKEFEDGDKTSNIKDDAGILRSFLKYLYENKKTRYVLLGGKPPHVPARIGFYEDSKYNKEIKKWEPDSIRIDTDLYFSDLDVEWNLIDGNKKMYMNVNNFPSITEGHLAVGRLPCTTRQEVLNYLNKLHIYENNPGNGDTSYLGKGMISVCNSFVVSDDYRDTNPGLYLKLNKYFESMTYHLQDHYSKLITGTSIIDDINAHAYGFVEFFGHGSPFGVATTQAEDWDPDVIENPNGIHGIIALNNEVQTQDFKIEDNNGLNCLKNKYFPFFSYSISCTTMPFTLYDELFYRPLNIKYTFGESIILGKEYGAIAYLGNTYKGYPNESQKMREWFLDQFNSKTNQAALNEVGKFELQSRILATQITKRLYHYKSLSTIHNLFGDPVINLWHSQPENYNWCDLNTVSSWESEYYKSSEVNYSNGNVQREDCTPNEFITKGKPINSVQVLYGNNMIPYYLPTYISDVNMFFDNRTFSGDKQRYTLYGKDFYLGISENGDSEYETTLSESNHLKIYSFGEVNISCPIIIRPGATLEISTLSPIKLENVIVMPNGTLKINAPVFNIGKGFDVRKGGVFEANLVNGTLF